MCQPRASSYDSCDSPNGITRALLLLQCCEARGQLYDDPSPPTSHELPSPTHPDKWTSPSTQQQLLICQKSPRRRVKNFISWKSSQSPSIRHRANIREHSKHRYIQPSCMAAEHGLCARLPPSFGHYTALTDIVGKDPTDQSTSWKSTTDEPSDHEPMSASPVHVWLPEFCHILFLASFFPSLG